MARWSAALGPGLVFALTAAGPASFVSNAAAGATYGYALIWVLGFTVVFRYVWLNTSAKYVLVTGESLLDGYRRVGKWMSGVVYGAAVVVRHLSNLYKVVLLGSCVHLLLPLPVPWSAHFWSLFSVLLAFAMVFWGGYPTIERFCKLLVALMTGALIVAAVLSRPDPVAILKAAVLPVLPANQGVFNALFLVMALIGGEAGSLTNVTYSYFVRAKGWRTVADLRRQRFDLLSSVACLLAFGTLVQIAAAAAIHPLGISPQTTDDLTRIFSESLGVLGQVIFGAGMWASAFSGFVGGTAGYALLVTDIWRRNDAGKEARKDPVYRWFVVFWCFSPLYVLFTRWEPVWLILVLNTVMLVLIPVLAAALLCLTNDTSRMGKYANGWVSNTCMGALIVTALWLMFRNFF